MDKASLPDRASKTIIDRLAMKNPANCRHSKWRVSRGPRRSIDVRQRADGMGRKDID
jgi:hypothetical protein